MNKSDYENIPFYYCEDCLSLNIKIDDDNTDYCDICGGHKIKQSSNMEKWENMYYKKYKINYYGRESKKRNH